MRSARKLVMGVFVAAMTTSATQAQVLTGSCTVVVHNQGKIALNASGNKLSSKSGGGQSVLATVTSQAGLLCNLTQPLLCYGLSAPAPLVFASSPLDGSVGAVFTSTYRLDNGAETAGSARATLLDGAHNVEVHLDATKAVGAFGAGDYRAEVVIRCE
jgi:hypothetical protein